MTRCSNYLFNHPLCFQFMVHSNPFDFLLTFEFSGNIGRNIRVLPQSAVDEIFGRLIIFGPMFRGLSLALHIIQKY